MSKYSLHPSVIKNIDTLKDKKLAELVKEFINYTPVDFVVIKNGAFRTALEQKEIYLKGHSRCDGYVHKSAHQSGKAIDLIPCPDGIKPLWDLGYAKALGASFKTFCKMKGYYIQWGADWNDDGVLGDSFMDPYHFEGLRKL